MAMEQEQREAMGQRISELRRRKRLRQPAVADAVGVTLRAYQAWEAGDSGIKWENAEELARVLDTKPDFIMYGENEQTEPVPDPFQDSVSDQLAEMNGLIRKQNRLLDRQSNVLAGIERLLASQLDAARLMDDAAAQLRSLQEPPEAPDGTP